MNKAYSRGLLLLLFLSQLFLYIPADAQEVYSDWQAYLSINNVRALDIDSNGNAWAATTGGLVYINREDGNFVEQHITPLDGLYKLLDPTSLLLDEGNNKIYIGYSDGVIEVYDINEQSFRRNLDIKNTDRFASKGINDIRLINDDLYISTPFGIVRLDTEKLVVLDTYTSFGNLDDIIAVQKVALIDGTIVGISANAIVYAEASNPELFLSENWQVISSNSLSESSFYDVLMIDSQYVVFGQNSFYRGTELNDLVAFYSSNRTISNVVYDASDNHLYWLQNSNRVYETPYSNINANLLYDFAQPVNEFEALSEGTIAIANEGLGYTELNLNGGVSRIESLNKPYSNNFTNMIIDEGYLISPSSGQRLADMPTSPTQGFYLYDIIEDVWVNYNKYTNTAFSANNIESIFNVTKTEDAYYFGTWGKGILRYNKSDQSFNFYNGDDGLDPVANGSPNYQVATGLDTDSNGRVWTVGLLSNIPLQYFDEETSVWEDYGRSNVTTSNDTYYNLFIDKYDHKWISLRDRSGQGLLILDTGSLADRSDDQAVKLTANSSSGNLPSNEVTTIIQDLNDEIWIGTASGIAKFVFPEFVLDGGPAERTAQWLINADTSAARPYLLPDISVNCMTVDGANNKWVGTVDNGIWVLNPEGNAVIDHITEDNSDLLSNGIQFLTLDGESGLMYVATIKGLMSVNTQTLVSSSLKKELKVYPNPYVYNKNSGDIHIEGLGYTTEIKIVSVDGQVIDSFTNTGGKASWKPQTRDGGLLGSGVYLILALDTDSNESVTGKFVIIR